MFNSLLLVALMSTAPAWSIEKATPYLTYSAFDIEEAKKRCQTDFKDSPEVYFGDFNWGYSLQTMEQRFEEIYNSGKRLFGHPKYDPSNDSFYIFYDTKRHLPVKISQGFIKNVTLHIETAIDRGYAEFVFFPDMGHSHLYFPQDHWDKNLSTIEVTTETRNKLYEAMLNDPKMQPLYHLTEQLKMVDENKQIIDDPILEFKYWHRNFKGTNDLSGKYSIHVEVNKAGGNTVREIDGYRRYGSGFAVSASKDGCFPYRNKNGETLYFDIGLHDPQPKNTSGAVYF